MTERRWQSTGNGPWRRIDATAPSLDQAFEDAALALAAIAADPATVATVGAVHFVCNSGDPQALFQRWLDSLRTEMAGRGVVLNRFQVHLRNGTLTAVGYGEAASDAQQAALRAIAGAALESVSVDHVGEAWRVGYCLRLGGDPIEAASCQPATSR